MTISPGVMSIFSSISSRFNASTRSGWSSMSRSLRVLAMTVSSSSSAVFGSRISSTCCAPATTSIVIVSGEKPGAVTVAESCPIGRVTNTLPCSSVMKVRAPTATVASEMASEPEHTSKRTWPVPVWALGWTVTKAAMQTANVILFIMRALA